MSAPRRRTRAATSAPSSRADAIRSSQSAASRSSGTFVDPHGIWPGPRAPSGQLSFSHARTSCRKSSISFIVVSTREAVPTARKPIGERCESSTLSPQPTSVASGDACTMAAMQASTPSGGAVEDWKCRWYRRCRTRSGRPGYQARDTDRTDGSPNIVVVTIRTSSHEPGIGAGSRAYHCASSSIPKPSGARSRHA